MLAAALAALAAAAPAAAQPSNVCLGDVTAEGVEKRPGPPVRWGITPAGEAGALGPMVPAVPDDPPKTMAALARLRPPGAPFVLRLNRFFWSHGEAGIQRFLDLTRRYTDAGYGVELQVRYHPRPDQEGDIEAWVRHVREVVDRFGTNRRVVALQVTNEVNLTFSPDSSDGAYRGARDALIQGVMAAKDQARRRGFHHLAIGFNWVYRTDPNNEASFWGYLRDRGGPAFVAAVDWVGLDAYPGTVFPPVEAPDGERDGMVNAMSSLRKCWMPIPGIPASVPIKVEENGWPTDPPHRSYAQQARALEVMVRAVHDFRGTYNVTDYRWFDLRDHRTSSQNFQHHYGLLEDDYSEKPAFGVYQRLLRELSGTDPFAGATARVGGVRLRVRYFSRNRRGRRGRAARCFHRRVRVSVARDGADVARVDFHVDGRRVARDRRAPFARRVRVGRRKRPRVQARVVLSDGRQVVLSRAVRRCRSAR